MVWRSADGVRYLLGVGGGNLIASAAVCTGQRRSGQIIPAFRAAQTKPAAGVSISWRASLLARRGRIYVFDQQGPATRQPIDLARGTPAEMLIAHGCFTDRSRRPAVGIQCIRPQVTDRHFWDHMSFRSPS